MVGFLPDTCLFLLLFLGASVPAFPSNNDFFRSSIVCTYGISTLVCFLLGGQTEGFKQNQI